MYLITEAVDLEVIMNLLYTKFKHWWWSSHWCELSLRLVQFETANSQLITV